MAALKALRSLILCRWILAKVVMLAMIPLPPAVANSSVDSRHMGM